MLICFLFPIFYLQDVMETVLKENFTDGTLVGDLWSKRTLIFDN